MKKVYLITFILTLFLASCEDNNHLDNGDENEQIYSIHKYLKLSGDGKGRVFIGNSNRLQLTDDFTIELLVNAQQTFRRAFLGKAKDRYRINYSLGTGTWNQPFFQIKNGDVPYTAHDTSLWFILEIWNHMAGVFTNNELKLYVNGELINVTDMVITPDTSGNLYIGWPGDDYYWLSECDGMIDEVRIWSIVRTQTQIQEFMTKEISPESREGLVSYWNFDDIILLTDGTTLIKDISGKSLDGKLEGNAIIEGY